MVSGGNHPLRTGAIDMTKLVLAASLVAAVVLAACGASTPSPSEPGVVLPSTSPAPSGPAGTPSLEPADPTAEPPVVTPAPTVTPSPAEPTFSRAERYLIDGILRGEGDCSPVRGDRLPSRAIAGIDCDLIGSPVARVGYYLFHTEADMLDVYVARMEAEGIALESGDGCFAREGESVYVPWDEADGIGPYRHGCFVNDEGYGNYRVTLPGAHVYVGLLGRTADMRALEEWAFLGSMDTPGYPTMWSPPFEFRP
jgi:hypothetical protein